MRDDDIDWRDAETLVRAACDGCEKPVLVRLPFPGQADIARAVGFLAGPSAAYITGETLHVNGGMYMP